jgi:hypothetical protein
MGLVVTKNGTKPTTEVKARDKFGFKFLIFESML